MLLNESEVFGAQNGRRSALGAAAPGATPPGAVFMDFVQTPGSVTYFVGRNGSGKSKAARAIARNLEKQGALYLSTDRLMGIMKLADYGWGTVPSDYKGPPIDDNRSVIDSESRRHGIATDILLTLREDPVVGLKVAAFLKKALGRTIEFRENAGFFDPFVRIGSVEYSLLRDEGHGLRELTVLLAAVYQRDWRLLVVDEPELHLHPALAQLWVSELSRECAERSGEAIVVTHEPTMIRPSSAEDLQHIWLFQPGTKPAKFSSGVHEGTENRIAASLQKNPQLVSQLAFAPRPVLVEGQDDVAALGVAMLRTQPSAIAAQTELALCGSSGDVALWFEFANALNIDVRAIADLDALFSSDVQRTIERSPAIRERLKTELYAEPPRAHVALRPLIESANAAEVAPNERARARWLANDVPPDSGDAHRRDRLIDMLKDEGLWLHPQGTLEDVLGIKKGKAEPAQAASTDGQIDAVAEWCAYDLDPLGDLGHLLQAAVERIANNITQALGTTPGVVLRGPVGPMAKSDAKLVDVNHLGQGRYRITVKAPQEFEGYFVEIDRDTPPSQIKLLPPRSIEMPE